MAFSLLKKGGENVVRHWRYSLPTVLVMAIVLTMFHALLTVHLRAKFTLESIQQKFSITVYLKDNADLVATGSLINALEKRRDVIKPIKYTSKEEAWELMKKTFALDSALLEKYRFSLPASLVITPRRIEDAPQIEAFISTTAQNLLKEPLSSKTKQKNLTEQMTEFAKNVKDSTLGTIVLFIALFAAGGTMLISSAIHLAISARHMEISIMKLVGASYGKITAPFTAEGLILGMAAFVLHVFFMLTLPLGFTISRFHLNALLFEFLAIMTLSASVSWLTARLHIKRETVI